MNILMVTPEVSPFVKLGGLGDVGASLPKALAKLGHDVRIVCPLYGSIKRAESWTALPFPLVVPTGQGMLPCRVWETTLPGSAARLYFLEYNDFYARPEVYAGPWGDHPDNPQRFAYLCKAAVHLGMALSWRPDIIHGHDWCAGLAPVFLHHPPYGEPFRRTASVFTIHNLQHQGYAPRGVLDFAQLPPDLFRPDNLESHGQVNTMKAGLYNSTKLTTVSPTYAGEIQEPEYGFGLNPVLRYRAGDLIGILNGIDTDEWNPAADEFLPARFAVDDLAGKAICKTELQRERGLAIDPTVPIFGVVSRLWGQKGLDLLAAIGPRLLETMRLQLVVLGNGEARLEDAFRELARRYPQQVSVFIGYNNKLAHQLYGGVDFFLMPSRFEPCGLGQMYAMNYGAPPVVRSTGGLVDTVPQYREGTGLGRGFRFEDATPQALYDTIGWAVSTWFDRPDDYRSLQRNGMLADFSWDQSARRYEEVYQWALELRQRQG